MTTEALVPYPFQNVSHSLILKKMTVVLPRVTGLSKHSLAPFRKLPWA